MSEEQQGEQEAAKQEASEAAAPEGEQQPEVKSYDEVYVKKLRDEAAANRVKLKEFEDRDKTDAQKAAERVAELERENAAFKLASQREQWAAEITNGSNVPAKALRGDTEEEMRKHFEDLKPLIPDTPTPGNQAPSNETPKGAWGPFDPDEGKSPGTPASGDWLRDSLTSR